MKITKKLLKRLIRETLEEIESEVISDEPLGTSIFDVPEPVTFDLLSKQEEKKKARETWGPLADQAFDASMNVLQSGPRHTIDTLSRAYIRVRNAIHSSGMGEDAWPREIEIQDGFDAALSSMVHRTVLGFDEGEI